MSINTSQDDDDDDDVDTLVVTHGARNSASGIFKQTKKTSRDHKKKALSVFNDQYELLETLGRGAFSTVRRCVQISTGQSFAVKIVQVGQLKRNSALSEILQAIRIETRICSLLKHPHIVQLIETFEDQHVLYMVFELIQGTDICSEIVAKAKSGFVYSEAVTRQLLEAVAYCHTLNIVHRDLKPQCVLLCDTSDGSAPVKLGGFGSAAIISHDHNLNDNTSVTISNGPYAAPELAFKQRFDFSADSWSLGVILHILLSGCIPCSHPYKINDSEETTMAAIVMEESKLFADISDAAKDLLKSLLHYDPDKRILPEAALEHPWIKQRVLCASKNHLSQTVKHLINFNRHRKLKAAILSSTEMRDDVLNIKSEEIDLLNQAISMVTDSIDDMQYLENPDICPPHYYKKLINNHRFCTMLHNRDSLSRIKKEKLICINEIIEKAFEHYFRRGLLEPESVQRLKKEQENVKALLEIMQAIANLENTMRHRKLSESVVTHKVIANRDNKNDTHHHLMETMSGTKKTTLKNRAELDETKLPSSSNAITYGLRLVQFQRRNDEPMGIAVKMTEDRKCVISRIIHGGLIHRQGILQVGDEIKEINAIPISTCKLNVIQEKLLNARGNISFKIVPNNRPRTSTIPCEMYVKALFNYDPLLDELNPCAKIALKFEIGDILKILCKDDYNWWQACKIANHMVEQKGGGGGLIPSPELQEWRIANESPTESVATDQKSKDGNCGIFIRRRKYKDKYLTKLNAIFQQLDLPTYEEVVSVRNFQWKTIVLLGAHGVGRRHLKNTLIGNEPNRYAYPIPHTTKLMPSSEENGKNYWFVTSDEMLNDIANNAYLEYGTHENAMYGTKLDTIRAIVNKPGMIAVLDVEPQALKVLRTAEFAPIIVFIAAPVLSEIRCIREASDDDCLERLVQESDLLQRTYAHLFDISIVNIDIDETVAKLRDILERKFYNGAQWVPAKWIY